MHIINENRRDDFFRFRHPEKKRKALLARAVNEFSLYRALCDAACFECACEWRRYFPFDRRKREKEGWCCERRKRREKQNERKNMWMKKLRKRNSFKIKSWFVFEYAMKEGNSFKFSGRASFYFDGTSVKQFAHLFETKTCSFSRHALASQLEHAIASFLVQLCKKGKK